MSDIRKEALLNEYKGNLYEFIFANLIARKFNLEIDFFNSINLNIKSMLEQQERFVREYYPHLLQDLPILAQSLVEDLVSKLNITSLTKVDIIGKVALASHDSTAGESDVLLETEKNKFFLSLKLGKSQSFLNTKSAGIKSFLIKYFNLFKDINQIQDSFNSYYDERYQSFALEMHQLAEIEFSKGFQSWIDHGLNELPGQLDGEFRVAYMKFTHDISKRLFSDLRKLYNLNEKHFKKSLYPLMGFSENNIIQVSTYYKNIDNHYQLDKNRIDLYIEDMPIKVFNIKERVNYCDIQFEDRTLQIRLKAMNKFTHSSFKINCSVKYLDN